MYFRVLRSKVLLHAWEMTVLEVDADARASATTAEAFASPRGALRKRYKKSH